MRKKITNKRTNGSVRVIFSLPRPLAASLAKYARICRSGNKSGFVADAIEAYIDSLHRHRHTQKLRQSYAAAAQKSGAIAADWQHLEEEAWAQLDELKTAKRK